jgi:hypothetical protein
MRLPWAFGSPNLTPGGPCVYPEFPLRAPNGIATGRNAPGATNRARKPWSSESGAHGDPEDVAP